MNLPMSQGVPWNCEYAVGHDVIDAQHQQILSRCSALADCVVENQDQSNLNFRDALGALVALAAEHFMTEAALLGLDAHLAELANERDEFEYLVQDITITDHFDIPEIQRFLSLWWVGHIVSFGKKYRNSSQ